MPGATVTPLTTNSRALRYSSLSLVFERSEKINNWRPSERAPEGVAAQSRWPEISGRGRTHYCGAYWRWGFHEDGVWSALRVSHALGGRGPIDAPLAESEKAPATTEVRELARAA